VQASARYAEDEADHRRRMTTNKRASYLNAFFGAISAKLSGQMHQMKLEHTRLAIVLHNDEEARDEAMDDVVPDRVLKAGPRRPKRRDLNANLAGWFRRSQHEGHARDQTAGARARDAGFAGVNYDPLPQWPCDGQDFDAETRSSVPSRGARQRR